jgi:hypothetical protein
MTRILTIIALMFVTPVWAQNVALKCRGWNVETGRAILHVDITPTVFRAYNADLPIKISDDYFSIDNQSGEGLSGWINRFTGQFSFYLNSEKFFYYEKAGDECIPRNEQWPIPNRQRY